jgi:hypothetical protein
MRASRDVAIVVLAGLLLIGAVGDPARSAASFSATSLNPGNQFVTATLSLNNDKAVAGSLITLANMVPGDTATRTVTLTNTGNVSFTYRSGRARPTAPCSGPIPRTVFRSPRRVARPRSTAVR